MVCFAAPLRSRLWVWFGFDFGGKWHRFFRNGFVWKNVVALGAEADEALEVLDGAAVLALGLGLVAEDERPGRGLFGQKVEALGERKVEDLLRGDAIFGDLIRLIVAERVVQAGGEHTGFEAVGAEHRKLTNGDPLDREDFLRSLGEVVSDGVGFEVVELVLVLEANDGESHGGEPVLAGVLRGSRFALCGAGAGRTGGVGAVGGDLSVGGLLHGDGYTTATGSTPKFNFACC
jgi:hypothetical protein